MKANFFLKSLIALLMTFLIGTNTSKATIHVFHMDNVYNTNQSACTSYPMPQDSILIYTSVAFIGATDWRLDGVPYSSMCDSMLWIPTTPGNYSIAAFSPVYGFQRIFILSIFSSPPSHATLQVFSGGNMNATNDTVWMCSTSLSMGANAIGSESTSTGWYGPSGFISSSNPIPISSTGIHYFQQENACGITRDTFVVISLPYTLPTLGDGTFCNEPITTTWDVGTGWETILWSTGATTQTLNPDTSGLYTVNLSNQCISGSVSATINHEEHPSPDLMYMDFITVCHDSVVTLNPNPATTDSLGYYLYHTYLWSTGETSPTIDVSGTSGYYAVTVTQGNCSAITGAQINFFEIPQTPEICIVTVDPTMTKNMIVFTNQYETGPFTQSPIASYNIYKHIGGSAYNLIGNVPVGQEHTFTDMTSSPPTISDKYKITMVDDCGTESIKSPYQKTILLSAMVGSTPGENPLIWSAYEDESGMFVVDQYEIWRGNHPDSLEYYKTVPASAPFTNYNDTGVYVQKYYQIVATRAGGCDPSPMGSKAIINGTQSNITQSIITGVPTTTNSIPNITVYPNPSTGIFSVRGKDITKVEVFDLTGRTIVETTSTHIDLSAYGAGYYKVRITTKYGPSNQQIIICK